MMVLDFTHTDFNPKELKPQNDFEQSVQDFLVNWYDESEVMMAQTSGSTGTPKLIRLKKEDMRKSARMTCDYLQLQPGNLAVLAMPVNYIAGKLMIVRAIERQLKLIAVVPTAHLKWEMFSAAFSHIDFVALTPMQVEQSLDFVAHCAKVIIGGAPLTEKVKKELLPMTNEIYETYAMTETITHIAFKQVQNQRFVEVSPYFEAFKEVRIAQDDRGCLVIHTPYEEAVVVTNDVVELTGERSFNWKGRADNIINSGGIKLFPEQIENALKPYISAAFFVTAKPDDLLGQKLVVVVEGEKQVLDISKAPLTKYQMPKEIIFVPQFPRTESGKIQRHKIQWV